MMKIIAIPFGWILKGAYLLVRNYGFALFLFTVIINLVMLPSRIKQQKESAKTAKLRPKLEQLQKKYANNREKYNEAQMELYNEAGVNPMGSCLPLIVTYVILFAIIEVVYAPMSYISNIDSDKIAQAQQTVVDYYYVSQAFANDVPENADRAFSVSERIANGEDIAAVIEGYNADLATASGTKGVKNVTEENLQKVIAGFEANPELYDYFTDTQKVSNRLLYNNGVRAQLIVLSVADDYPELFDQEVVDFCEDFDYTIFGLYLGRYPSWKSVYVIIPIMSLVAQVVMMVVSQLFMKRNGMDAGQGKGMMGMLYVMPLISFWIAFSFPAGIGIYWIFSSLVQLGVTVFINLYYTPARLDKILENDKKKARKRPSLYQMALEQQKAMNAQNGNADSSLLDTDEIKLSKNERKEIERQRINEARAKLVMDDEEDVDPRVLEARKKMAEKYGDDY